MKPADLIMDRGLDYGPYADNARRMAEICLALNLPKVASMHPDKHYAMVMIAAKLARLSFKPDHEDSWRDIETYARLAVEGDGKGV